MTDNTMAGVYTDRVYELVDNYIDTELNNEEDIYNPSVFTGMILYIADNIDKPDHNDIELLDNVFGIYIRLCCKYRMLPTLECFGFMVSINCNTFSSWINGEYRSKLYYDKNGNRIKHIQSWMLNHQGEEYRAESGSSYSITAKKWKDTCRSFLVNNLSNSKGADVNKIFIAKAAYGMVETAPVPTISQDHQRTPEQIAADYAPQIAQKTGDAELEP